MKFSKSTVALGLAAGASASSDWDSWNPTTSTASSSTVAPVSWTCPAPVTSTKTETVTSYKDTTTIYRSTIFVGPGVTTVYPSTCPNVTPVGPTSSSKGGAWASWASNSASTPAAPASSSSSKGGAWGPGSASSSASGASGSWASWAPGPASSPVGPAGSSGWGITRTITSTVPPPGATTGWPAGGEGGQGGEWTSLNPGVSGGSIVATGGWEYTASPVAEPTTTAAAPTYSGWNDWSPSDGSGDSSSGGNGGSGGSGGNGGSGGSGSGIGGTGSGGSGINGTGPAPGTDASNCTKPFEPLKDSSCNTAADRSKWCGGKTIGSDYYAADYSTGQICSYDLTITNTTLNFDGLPKLSHAINGQVPGPMIECNWGDTIVIKVTNKMESASTSIHWHGIVQKGTNDQDGVPGVTECAIPPGSSKVYKFQAHQYGTGWYHSHAFAQLGDGIRGPMVIHGPATANYDVDMGTVMIDDTFGNATGLTAAAQNKIISHTGPKPIYNYLLNGANTSPDNKIGKHATWKVQPGKKHLFRLINSASQNFWSVHFDNHKMTVIASDYVPIVPYQTEWLDIAIGQRYDVIVEMNQPVAGYFLRAVTQTGCPSGAANTGLGVSNGIFVYDGADLTLPTSTAGNKTVADFAYCRDEPMTSLVPYLKKGAGTASAFQASASTLPAGNVALVNTTDDGTIFRWFLNNGAINIDYTQPTLKSLFEGLKPNNSLISNPVIINSKNEWVYFVIQNQFFATHPIHLHGHDLSLLGQGTVAWTPSLTSTLNFDNPPRRDTATLAGSKGPGFPAGYTVIGFQSDNPGAWLMHCHIVWHVDGGLAMQWIERPNDIPKYGGNQAFQENCAASQTFFTTGGGFPHLTSESGLKRRTYFDELLAMHNHDNVVRRSSSPEKRFIDSYVKRGLGDGFKPRHGARR